MTLSIALTSAALLLAVPVGLVVFLISFRAVGPWRTRPRVVPLPDLADECQGWTQRAPAATRQPAVVMLRQEGGERESQVRPSASRRGTRPLALNPLPYPADARPAA